MTNPSPDTKNAPEELIIGGVKYIKLANSLEFVVSEKVYNMIKSLSWYTDHTKDDLAKIYPIRHFFTENVTEKLEIWAKFPKFTEELKTIKAIIKKLEPHKDSPDFTVRLLMEPEKVDSPHLKKQITKISNAFTSSHEYGHSLTLSWFKGAKVIASKQLVMGEVADTVRTLCSPYCLQYEDSYRKAHKYVTGNYNLVAEFLADWYAVEDFVKRGGDYKEFILKEIANGGRPYYQILMTMVHSKGTHFFETIQKKVEEKFPDKKPIAVKAKPKAKSQKRKLPD